MAQRGFAAFLLILGLVVSNVYGENATLCETILNATLSNASLPDFNLTVSPAVLSSNKDYQVELHGTGNFTVLLQAVTLSSPVGKWSPENISCNASLLFIDHSLTISPINTTWTSPDNVTSVTINAYIHNDTLTFLLHQTLNQEPVANTTTTEVPSTANKTESTKVTVATSTSNHVQQTTGAGSVAQFSLVSLTLSVIFSLLLIPSNYLS